MRRRRSILREVAAHQQQALHIPPRIASSTTTRFLSPRRHEELTSSPGWQVAETKTRREHLLTRQGLSILAGMFDLSKASIPSIQCSCFANTFIRSISPVLHLVLSMFSTISGNLLLARSKPRCHTWIGFWHSSGTVHLIATRKNTETQ